MPSFQFNKRRILLAIAVALIAIGISHALVPSRHLPWRPLDLNDEPGLATGLKLRALNYLPRDWCAGVLANARQLGLTHVPADQSASSTGLSCGWTHAYQLNTSHQTAIHGTGPYPMNCPLVAASHLWLRQSNALAEQVLGQPIKQVHHSGTYSCRRMYGRKTGPMSEHAYANAWDITGFELADGRLISVLKDWTGEKPASRFLRAARDAGCDYFNVVLSPDYNAAHKDHFHVDMGMGLACR